MDKAGIKVGSVTYASKGRAILVSNGIRAYISRNPHPAKGEGCGYLIIIDGDTSRAVEILKKNGVKVYGVQNAGDML